MQTADSKKSIFAPSPSPEEMREIHAVLLEMMSDIDALCRKHGLTYTLYCGTLLGAVRDGGLIPWDDDADLMMPADDCRRFLRLARSELSEKYVIQDLSNTPAHPWLWIRVFRKGTAYLRKNWQTLPVHHGIALDIYPMIRAADSKTGLKLQVLTLNVSKALRHVDYWRETGYPKDPKLARIARVLEKMPAGLRRFLSRMLLAAAARQPKPGHRCCTLDGAAFSPKYEAEDWERLTETELGGHRFLIPEAYDKLLTVMYGDWRTPPPEEKRGGHGAAYGGVLTDAHRDYTEYLKG